MEGSRMPVRIIATDLRTYESRFDSRFTSLACLSSLSATKREWRR
jgi:hypothetical protein